MARRPHDIDLPRRAKVLAASAVALVLGLSAAPASAAKTAFNGNGMWIWELRNSSGGNLDAIVSKAHAHKIRTVYVKSGDGTHDYPSGQPPQFTSKLVSKLHAGGLEVCAWQYVYGDRPGDEANVAARAIARGADCFVIDAESQYEGKYSSARKYVKKLRSKAGSGYPIGLAGFPYVDYHPSFPYSVFLGPGGAQFNLPQVYWKEISGGVDTVLGHTYRWNRPYGRTIYPLGQLYSGVHGRPGRSEILRFRRYARAEGAPGVSWWDWQEATSEGWKAVGASLGSSSASVEQGYATLAKGDSGDYVLWAQQHLRGAGQKPPLDGSFGSSTKSAVKSFQRSAGITVNGKVDTATWFALLRYKPRQAGSAKLTSASRRAERREIPPPSARH